MKKVYTLVPHDTRQVGFKMLSGIGSRVEFILGVCLLVAQTPTAQDGRSPKRGIFGGSVKKGYYKGAIRVLLKGSIRFRA